jgi:beta-lactamase class A
VEEQKRQIKFDPPTDPATLAKFSGTREGKPPKAKVIDTKKAKVEGNPRLVFAVLTAMVGITAMVWVGKALPGMFSNWGNPRIVKIEGDRSSDLKISKSSREIDWDKLRVQIEGTLLGARGNYAVYIYDLSTDESMGIKETQVMMAASLIKLPLMVSMYRQDQVGEIDLEAVYKLKDGDKVGGAGSMAYQAAGTEYSYRKLIELMGQQSDNTAFNVIVKLLGEKKVNDEIKEMGMINTNYDKNLTTAYDVGTLFRDLYKGELLTKKNTDEMFKFLTKTIFEDRIPQGVSSTVKVAHKVGTEVGVVSDGGIIFAQNPYILVIMSEGASLEEGKKLLPEVSRVVWETLGV